MCVFSHSQHLDVESGVSRRIAFGALRKRDRGTKATSIVRHYACARLLVQCARALTTLSKPAGPTCVSRVLMRPGAPSSNMTRICCETRCRVQRCKTRSHRPGSLVRLFACSLVRSFELARALSTCDSQLTALAASFARGLFLAFARAGITRLSQHCTLVDLPLAMHAQMLGSIHAAPVR